MTSGSAGTPPRCRVLLSTYNGSRFLAEQIASVLDQHHVQVHLHVRDDGSTDETVILLHDLAATDARITYEVGERLGPAQSYLTMLSETSADVDYVALCDQDDVWIAGKLDRAIAWLSPLSGPAMYCSAVEVVNERLDSVGIHRTCRRGPALENAHVQNIATGCTIVLNRSALPLFRKIPPHPVMHDAWIYLVVAAAGHVRYDPETWVRYRQHQSNSIGLAASERAQWVRRMHQHVEKGRDRVHTHQAADLLDLLGPELSSDAVSTISDFLQAQTSPAGRIRYALVGAAFRQRHIDSIVYRFLYALGRI